MDYTQNAKQVAQQLIGLTLDINGVRAEIVETEAYEGGNQTARRKCMNMAPGQIGIMPYRGLNFVNISSEAAGTPSCVLLRAVEIDGKVIEGPGRVGNALDATNIEYRILGTDITVLGESKPFTELNPEKQAENSVGLYRRR